MVSKDMARSHIIRKTWTVDQVFLKMLIVYHLKIQNKVLIETMNIIVCEVMIEDPVIFMPKEVCHSKIPSIVFSEYLSDRVLLIKCLNLLDSCSDTLHHYINDCVGALNKLKKYKNKNAVKDPYYDIKTHEEREIEYEVLTQKFIEILHKLVMLKTADEHVYDTKKPQNFYIKSPLTTTTTSLPPINPIDPYYNRVPVYYYPPYHAPYLYNQDYSFNELDFELPSENKQYKLKKRKGKNLEQVGKQNRTQMTC